MLRMDLRTQCLSYLPPCEVRVLCRAQRRQVDIATAFRDRLITNIDRKVAEADRLHHDVLRKHPVWGWPGMSVAVFFFMVGGLGWNCFFVDAATVNSQERELKAAAVISTSVGIVIVIPLLRPLIEWQRLVHHSVSVAEKARRLRKVFP